MNTKKTDYELIQLALTNKKMDKTLSSDELLYCSENRILENILVYNDQSYNNKNSRSINHHKYIKYKALSDLIDAIENAEINYVFIKGLAMSKYYPQNVLRQSNDFDFVIDTLNDFFLVYNILRELGFEYFQYPSFSYIEGEVKGTSKFKKVINEIEVLIEINVGGFALSEVTWIDSKKLQYNKQKIFFENLFSFYAPSDSNNMLIFLIEVCGRKRKMLRDNIDFYFLSKNLLSKNLEEEFSYLINDQAYYIKSTYKHFNKLNNNLVNKQKNFENNYNSLLKLHLLHVIPYDLNLFRKLIFYFIKIGNVVVESNRNLRLFKKSEEILKTKRVFLSGIPVHFVPLNLELKTNNLIWKEVEGVQYVSTPVGTYSPSVFGIFFEDDQNKLKEIK